MVKKILDMYTTFCRLKGEKPDKTTIQKIKSIEDTRPFEELFEKYGITDYKSKYTVTKRQK